MGAFFSSESDAARRRELRERHAGVEAWLRESSSEPPSPQVAGWLAEARATQMPFHWEIEFPEVFIDDREDPLEGDAINRAAWVDAVVGNPPFMGGRNVSQTLGSTYSAWLANQHASPATADYSAHFFRRADWLLGRHGTAGLIATNTIAQGDTRVAGLKHLISRGHRIYEAHVSMPWPGEASVSISVVHLAKGAALAGVNGARLDGRHVQAINSRLMPIAEQEDPRTLPANDGLSFQGSIVLGMGFVISPAERELLVARNPRNAERILPYIGGEEVNTHPAQMYERYVIDLGERSEAEAREWPELFDHLRKAVWPERKSKDAKKYPRMVHEWWKFWNSRPALYAAIASLERCLVTAIVSKHVIFSFQPCDRVFSHKICVFPRDDYAFFAVLQSRIHCIWATVFSSTLGGSGINYSPTDCFQTFPLPRGGAALADAGRRMYEARSELMLSMNVGLTKLYNALKDPAENEARVLRLREMHEELDRAVLADYGWVPFEVPAFHLPAEDAARQRFETEVLERLLAANAPSVRIVAASSRQRKAPPN